MKHLFTILFTLLMVFSGFSQEKASNENKCNLKLNFNSAGSGIDTKTYDQAVSILKEYKASYTESNYGREGETEFCILTNGLKKKQKKELLKRLKKTAKCGQLVSLSES